MSLACSFGCLRASSPEKGDRGGLWPGEGGGGTRKVKNAFLTLCVAGAPCMIDTHHEPRKCQTTSASPHCLMLDRLVWI